jgi:hypothetical protein
MMAPLGCFYENRGNINCFQWIASIKRKKESFNGQEVWKPEKSVLLEFDAILYGINKLKNR